MEVQVMQPTLRKNVLFLRESGEALQPTLLKIALFHTRSALALKYSIPAKLVVQIENCKAICCTVFPRLSIWE